MSEPGDSNRLFLTVLFAAWVFAFCYAFFSFTTQTPTGDGFTRGMNRITTYLGWQGVAGMLGLAIFAVGRSWPKRSTVRVMSIVPIGLALLHVAAIIGIILWVRASG